MLRNREKRAPGPFFPITPLNFQFTLSTRWITSRHTQKPLFCGITDVNGHFRGTIILAYAKNASRAPFLKKTVRGFTFLQFSPT